MEKGTVVKFDRIKHFINMGTLGSGGTGDTYLFMDETTEMLFAFKKYAPKDNRYVEDYYRRFVDEIKILFNLSHPNIVRIFNYYLYPDNKVGYLQMEYIEGVTISEFEPQRYFKSWEDIFKEVIETFNYLEKKKILHRDIRSENIMIGRDGGVKIIDFGFGKQLEHQEVDGKSIFLNWPVTQLPEEVVNQKIYTHQSEIYFIGKLFIESLGDGYFTFKFKHILEKMIKLNSKDRYESFLDISAEISQGVLGEIDFTDSQKTIYRNLINFLDISLLNHWNNYEFNGSYNQIMSKLDNLIRNSALEEYIQVNNDLISCFINNGFTYNKSYMLPTENLIDFYHLMTSLDDFKQKILLDNINVRLSKKPIKTNDDILPF